MTEATHMGVAPPGGDHWFCRRQANRKLSDVFMPCQHNVCHRICGLVGPLHHIDNRMPYDLPDGTNPAKPALRDVNAKE